MFFAFKSIVFILCVGGQIEQTTHCISGKLIKEDNLFGIVVKGDTILQPILPGSIFPHSLKLEHKGSLTKEDDTYNFTSFVEQDRVTYIFSKEECFQQ